MSGSFYFPKPVPVNQGGTNLTTYDQGDILYADAANSLARLPKNTTTQRVLTNGGANNGPSWDLVSLGNGVTGTLTSTKGGTGFATATTTWGYGLFGAGDDSFFHVPVVARTGYMPNIDGKTTGALSWITVFGSGTLYLYDVLIKARTMTGVLTNAAISIGQNAASYNDWMGSTLLQNVTTTKWESMRDLGRDAGTPPFAFRAFGSGEEIFINVTTGATGTAFVFDAIGVGMYV